GKAFKPLAFGSAQELTRHRGCCFSGCLTNGRFCDAATPACKSVKKAYKELSQAVSESAWQNCSGGASCETEGRGAAEEKQSDVNWLCTCLAPGPTAASPNGRVTQSGLQPHLH